MTGNTDVALTEIFRRAEVAGRDAIKIVAANIEDASLSLGALIGISTASSVLGVSTTDVTSILASRVTPTVSAVTEITIAGITTTTQIIFDFFSQWVGSAVSDFYNTSFAPNNYVALNAQAFSALSTSPQPSTPTANTPTERLLELAKAAVRQILAILKAAGKEAFVVAAGVIGANVAAAVLGITASPAALAITGAFVGVVLRETPINGVEFTGQQLADFFNQWFTNAVRELWGLTFDPNNYVIIHARALQTFQSTTPNNPSNNPSDEEEQGSNEGGDTTSPIAVHIGEGTAESEGTSEGTNGETIEIISNPSSENPVVDVQPADADITDVVGDERDDGNGGDDSDDGDTEDDGGNEGGDPNGS